jgi:hypothetical protein
MNRAQKILESYSALLGTTGAGGRNLATGIGMTMAAPSTLAALHRMRSKEHDKVRQAGMGKKLDVAKKAATQATKRVLVNPLSKKRRDEYTQAHKELSSTIKTGKEKFGQMVQKAGPAAKVEITR